MRRHCCSTRPDLVLIRPTSRDKIAIAKSVKNRLSIFQGRSRPDHFFSANIFFTILCLWKSAQRPLRQHFGTKGLHGRNTFQKPTTTVFFATAYCNSTATRVLTQAIGGVLLRWPRLDLIYSFLWSLLALFVPLIILTVCKARNSGTSWRLLASAMT